MQGENKSLSTFTQTATAVQSCFCLFLFFIGVFGNGFICFAVFRFKAFRTIPNILMTNMAAVNLLNIVINAPVLILTIVYIIFCAKATAWWTSFLFILFVQLNLSSMLLLVVDRYLALTSPINYTLWRTRQKTYFAIFAVWTWCFLVTGLANGPTYDFEMGAKAVYHYRSEYAKRFDLAYHIVPPILILLIPIIFFSILTVRQVLKKSILKTAVSGIQNIRRNGRVMEKFNNTKSARTILIVLLIYAVHFVCFMSVGITSLYSEKNRQLLHFLAWCAFLCGSVCNSSAYVLLSYKFRKALQQTFTCKKYFKNRVHVNQKKEGKVFYINNEFGKKVVVVK